MKHAFIFGTNIYLTDGNTVNQAVNEQETGFLKILSFYHDNKTLVIDADIISDGHTIKIVANNIEGDMDGKLVIANNRVQLYHGGHEQPVLDVFQLDVHEYPRLSSFITNEIESQQPDHVLTVKGNFMAAGVHINIDNEKLYINDDVLANGVTNNQHGVMLTPD